MSWRPSALVREATLNILANGARSLVIVLLLGAAIGALAFLELGEANDLAAFRRDYAAAGGFVAVVVAHDDSLSAERCEGLHSWPGVVAAGSVRNTGTVSFTSAPGVLFQSAAVSPGILAVWRPGSYAAPALDGGSFIAGAALAKELGLVSGSFTARTGEQPALVQAVIDTTRRNPQAQRWALEVGPPAGSADECWVEFDRETHAAGFASLPAWFAAGTQEPVARPYLRADEFTRDPAREFADRPQRFGWLAVGGLAIALFVLMAWFRRAELGLYLALGTSRIQLLVLLALEAGILIVFAAGAAIPWAVALHSALGHSLPADHMRLALRAGVSGALLALALAPIAASLVARGDIAALLKER